MGREVGADINLRLDALRHWRNKEKTNADRNLLERIERVSKQWRTQLNVKPNSLAISHETAGRLIAAAYPERIAKQDGEQEDTEWPTERWQDFSHMIPYSMRNGLLLPNWMLDQGKENIPCSTVRPNGINCIRQRK